MSDRYQREIEEILRQAGEAATPVALRHKGLLDKRPAFLLANRTWERSFNRVESAPARGGGYARSEILRISLMRGGRGRPQTCSRCFRGGSCQSAGA